ncbi:MAG TPA: hypothetical protein VH395_06245, partial [Jatrophihabitantaceae bacterium]
ALRRGRLPGNVPFGGGSQALARRLVAAALLLGGAATAFGGVASSAGSGHAPAAPRHAAVTPAKASTAKAEEKPQAALPAAHQHKYYVVQPPHGRHYDCLWDIAERTMGDPMRYKEIFELNKDRVQADGSRLVDANLIRPGWQLRLPADATGPGVHEAHAKAPARPAARAGTAGQADSATPVTAEHPSSVPAVDGAEASTVLSGSGGFQQGSLDTSVLGGGLMLAGILLALTARRGPYGEGNEEEEALGTFADVSLATSLDRALRNLAAGRRAQQRSLPQPVVAWASAEEVSLNLAGGDLTDPPAPWTVGPDEHTWTCRLADVRGEDDETAAPYPGLVSVGRHDGYELFADFEQAPGLVSIGGDIERARELATGLAVQAVTSAWSDGARATLVGFADGDEIVRVDPHSIDSVARLDTALAQFEREQHRVRELQRELGVDGVLSGRLAQRSPDWRPHLVVFSGQPSADEVRRLEALIGTGRSPFVAIVVGDTQLARWRFVVDGEGTVDLGVLGATARAHRLSHTSIPALVELLENATQRGREQARTVATMTPHQAVRAAAVPVRPQQPATVRVSLLGPVTVEAPGPIDPARRDLATEIAVALALHPEGLRDPVLRASIWPRGVSDAVRDAAMRDVTAWFGTDAISCPDGVWTLGGSVAVDWDELRYLAGSAAGPSELASLLRAVELFRGDAFSGGAPGRYGWLAFARAARDARVVGTAVTRRAAALLVDQHRPDEAERVLRRGLDLVPTAEAIWRDLLNLTSPRGPQPVAMVAD